MDESGIPSLGEVAEVTNAATGLVGAIQKILPGISRRSEAKAESKAMRLYMKDAETYKAWALKEGYSEKYIAMMIDDMYRKYTKQDRFEKVLEFAAETVKPNAELQEPDQSWAEEFQEHAEKACDEDMQRTWGAILAGEMEEPGSVSKRAMDILSKMSKREAESFRKLCGFSTCFYDLLNNRAHVEFSIPVLRRDSGYTSYNDNGISVKEIGILDSIGLVKNGLSNPLRVSGSNAYSLYTKSGIVCVTNDGDSEKEVSLGICVFFPAGIELARVCGIGSNENLMGLIIDEINEKGLKARVLEYDEVEFT